MFMSLQIRRSCTHGNKSGSHVLEIWLRLRTTHAEPSSNFYRKYFEEWTAVLFTAANSARKLSEWIKDPLLHKANGAKYTRYRFYKNTLRKLMLIANK